MVRAATLLRTPAGSEGLNGAVGTLIATPSL